MRYMLLVIVETLPLINNTIAVIDLFCCLCLLFTRGCLFVCNLLFVFVLFVVLPRSRYSNVRSSLCK